MNGACFPGGDHTPKTGAAQVSVTYGLLSGRTRRIRVVASQKSSYLLKGVSAETIKTVLQRQLLFFVLIKSPGG